MSISTVLLPQTVQPADDLVFDRTQYGTQSSQAEERGPFDFLLGPPLKVAAPILVLAAAVFLVRALMKRPGAGRGA